MTINFETDTPAADDVNTGPDLYRTLGIRFYRLVNLHRLDGPTDIIAKECALIAASLKAIDRAEAD